MRAYAIVTQLIIEAIALALIGYFIGYKINPDGILKGILATVGAIIGIMYFIGRVIRYDFKGKKRKL